MCNCYIFNVCVRLPRILSLLKVSNPSERTDCWFHTTVSSGERVYHVKIILKLKQILHIKNISFNPSSIKKLITMVYSQNYDISKYSIFVSILFYISQSQLHFAN
jgi:hypothetical protein